MMDENEAAPEHAAWRMPIETAEQERIWMAFPPSGGTMQEDAAGLEEARRAWSAVAHAILDWEPVSMIVNPPDMAAARRFLSASIECHEARLDDAWMRDIGPTFVVDDTGRLGAVDWQFNGWGQQDWSTWDHDCKVARLVAGLAGAEHIESHLVNEGGAIQVDGRGTVLLTDSVQLGQGRNPDWSREEVETEIHQRLGTQHAIWLERGLYRDAMRYGTLGHVDIVAAIPEPGLLLVHEQRDNSHPDHAISARILEELAASQTADGKSWTIRKVPAPRTLRDSEDFVDYSYINHVAINGAVLACTFSDAADDEALGILAEAYPGRRIVGVEARALFARGGGIHCITQQQPRVG